MNKPHKSSKEFLGFTNIYLKISNSFHKEKKKESEVKSYTLMLSM